MNPDELEAFSRSVATRTALSVGSLLAEIRRELRDDPVEWIQANLAIADALHALAIEIEGAYPSVGSLGARLAAEDIARVMAEENRSLP